MKNLIIWLNRIITKHKALKRWKRIVTVLAAIMTFATTYMLILPAITVERNKVEDVVGMYLEQEEDRNDILLENALEPIGVSIAAEQENAVTFAYADDSMTATAIFSTEEEIPQDAELVVNPVDPASEEYMSLSSRSAELLDKEFIYDVTTCSFYDFALVCGNADVTPNTGLVDIQIIFHSNTVEHTDDTLFGGSFAKPAAKEVGFAEIAAGDKTAAERDAADTLIAVNPDESSVFELTDGIITVLSLKGYDLARSDSLVGILAGHVDEEIKAAAADTDAPAVKTLKATGDDYTVTLNYDATSKIPVGADLIVSEISQDSKEYQNYLKETKKAMGLTEEETLPSFAARFFDIKIMVGDEEFSPKTGVSVEITYEEPLADKDDAEVSAVHFADENAEAEVIEASTMEIQDGGAATVEFTAESFSVYGVIYTVDFHWEVNGKVYDFSIPGGGYVSFYDLVEVLGIVANDADTEEDKIQDLVNGTRDIAFSNPGLVSVSKADEDTTVGAIKERLGLECESSAELTEEQIAEINAKEVRAGDWAVIAIRPFDTEESMTVTMNNDEQFVVKVTDAQIRKDFVTVSGDNYEFIVTYDESAEIPADAKLEITEYAKGSGDYQAAREAVIGKKQSEIPDFDDSEIGIAAFDLSILDRYGKQVEPKTGVSVSMTIKHLPEEAVEADVQDSIEIHHLDESSGDVKVETVASAADGSIQVEEESAQAEFQLESFSTFTVSWNRRSESNSTTTFGWQDGSTARGYITASYKDESGNNIQRPSGVNYTVYHTGFNNNVTNSFNIGNELGQSIPNYTFAGAYVTVDGTKQQVDTVTARRTNDVTTVTYYYNGQEVLSASYDATSALNKRHDFTADGLGLTLVYTKNNNFTTIHYGYMDGDTFVEFDEQPRPTNTSTDFGWAYLIYDFAGKDDLGLHVDWKYSGTYYHTSETTNPEQGGVTMQPILRYNNINNKNAWRYYDGAIDTYGPVREDANWHEVSDDSDIYVVYEKPSIPMGGNPTLTANGHEPDVPKILKESVENGDGTNTLSLSVTGSRAPAVAEKIADVIVILDLSSSMRKDIGSGTAYDDDYQSNERSRYYQAKKAVQTLADTLYELNGTDGQQYRMGLITFSNKATVRQTPTADKDEFQAELNRITKYEGSGTNWEHSLQLANQMSVASDRSTYIVFITDGEPSVRQTRSTDDTTHEQLTNEQLSGANWTRNPAQEGDIFHGGMRGGVPFISYSNPPDTTTPDFRDYFGSATFGGLENKEPWDTRNRNAGIDEVKSIVGHNKGFYAIGVSSDVNKLGEFVEAGEVDSNHYQLVTSSQAFEGVINDILNELTNIDGKSGQADVMIYDGITDLTQTIAKVNQEENRLQNAEGNFKYYKSNAPADWGTWTDAQKEAYIKGVRDADTDDIPLDLPTTPEELEAYYIGKDISYTEWDISEDDSVNPAVYNPTTRAVEWNMGEKFMLEDGVTYKVSFICWPSQEAYDIIAKLENHTLVYEEDDDDETENLTEEQRKQIKRVGDTYTLKTNEDDANTTYHEATMLDGNVTVGDLQDPLSFGPVDPLNLEKDKFNVVKSWEASKIDTQDPQSVEMQVWGGNEMYKDFTITPVEITGGSSKPNRGKSEDIYISCGLLKVDKPNADVVIYESGHDFSLREVEENSRHWDLSASTYRPMVINNSRTMLVLVEGNDIPAGMRNNANLAYLNVDSGDYAGEYYRIDGKVYKDLGGWADLNGSNTRRSFLDLAKEVLVDNEVWDKPVEEKFTYKIKIDIDPITMSWDPDIEKYIIISIRGDGYTPAAAIADQTYPTTAKLPSQSGMDASLIHENYDNLYLVAESGVEFYLSIKNGWSVRFLNLPVGTSFSIEEVLPDESNYEFDNARLETRKDRETVAPITQEAFDTETVEGSIEETSTLYKAVYQNLADFQKVWILKTSQDASTPLGGAVFDLYTQSAYTTEPKGEPLKKNLVSSSETVSKGRIDLGSLPVGVYYLVETSAPRGYILKEDPVIITINKTTVTYDDGTSLSQTGGISQIGDVYQLKVTNDEGASLPHTGGHGTRLYMILGMLLIAGAGLLLWRRRRAI